MNAENSGSIELKCLNNSLNRDAGKLERKYHKCEVVSDKSSYKKYKNPNRQTKMTQLKCE